MNDQTEKAAWIGPQDALGELQRRTAMLDAIGYAATRIVTSGDWQAGIQELLDRLGQQVLGLKEGATALDGLTFQTRPLYYGDPWFLAASIMYYRWRDRQNR